MKTKQEHINFWIEQVCKALWIKHNNENLPPLTHNLIYLLSSTQIDLTDDRSEFMLSLNRFQLEGRYPDYLTKMHDICNEHFTVSMLETTNDLKLWLQEKLR